MVRRCQRELPLKPGIKRDLEMADFLGLTIETVSRQMTNLRKTAIISIQNKRIVNCPDLARLKRAGGIE